MAQPAGRMRREDEEFGEDFLTALLDYDEDEIAEAIAGLSPHAAEALLGILPAGSTIERQVPPTPLAQARSLDLGYRERAHLVYLSDRLAKAVADVEAGTSRRLLVSMPPRTGKSHLTSTHFPTWLLRKHPDWKIGLLSHSPHLAVSWGRAVRRLVEEHGGELGLTIAKDAGAASDWQTTSGGGITSRSMPGQTITGLGFKVMLIDDPVKDAATAHSNTHRDAAWMWWQAAAATRLEPPSLVVVVMTRWHEDDFAGRLLSGDYDGDPDEWEVISFPAIAEHDDDVLGRAVGEPLISPLLDETTDEAIERWEGLRKTVGSYTWTALYQQRPAPAEGAIFDASAWCYWTTDPERVTEDGRVVLLDPEADLASATWVDSWDFTFKGADADGGGDYVVGQRWARLGPRRFLVAQQRGRWSFTQSLDRMLAWAGLPPSSKPGAGPVAGPGLGSAFVHRRLVEDAANGPAIIDTVRNHLSGVHPVRARVSKVERARAVTPEVESGHVYLPHPADEGNGWVTALLSELRNFPNDAHDDQVDSLTQALLDLRTQGVGSVTVPRRTVTRQSIGSAARSSMTTRRLPGRG